MPNAEEMAELQKTLTGWDHQDTETWRATEDAVANTAGTVAGAIVGAIATVATEQAASRAARRRAPSPPARAARPCSPSWP